MSTKHAKTKNKLFNIGIIESVPVDGDIVDSTPVKKKKKEGLSFYVKDLKKSNTIINTSFDEAFFTKNEINRYNNNLKPPEDVQVVQSEQPSEGDYKSIWKNPKIRPNVEFEKEEVEGACFGEEFDFDNDEEDCIADESESCAIKASAPIYKTFRRSTLQPETPPPLKVTHDRYIPPLSPEEESPEDTIKTSVTATKDVLQVKDICSDPSEYIGVTDDLHETIREMKKEPLMGNIELWDSSLNPAEITAIQEGVSKLCYIKKKERITDEPINEV